MIVPRVDLRNNKETYTRREVEEMLDSITKSFDELCQEQFIQYKVAKNISYLSLIVAILVLAIDLFK